MFPIILTIIQATAAAPMTTTPALFYYVVGAGLLFYILKKFLAASTWNPVAFAKLEATGLINSIWITAGLAYLLPDLVLAANDYEVIGAFALKHPHLVDKITIVAGGALGFSGGSIAMDLLPMTYNLPWIGPKIKQAIDLLRGAKADRMAADLGIQPNAPPKPKATDVV